LSDVVRLGFNGVGRVLFSSSTAARFPLLLLQLGSVNRVEEYLSAPTMIAVLVYMSVPVYVAILVLYVYICLSLYGSGADRENIARSRKYCGLSRV
jgi:hypothetical protein